MRARGRRTVCATPELDDDLSTTLAEGRDGCARVTEAAAKTPAGLGQVRFGRDITDHPCCS